MPPKNDDKNKSKDKTSTKSKSQNKGKGKTTQSKSRAKRVPKKKAKHVSRSPFIFIIILLLGVIAFLLLRKTDINLPSPAVDKRNTSVVKPDAMPEKKAKTDETDKTNKTDKVNKADKKLNVQVWFLSLNEKTENISLMPVRRSVLEDGKIENALKALIDGPSAEEKAKGCLTAVPSNLKVRGIKIKNRVAEIDFNTAIGEEAAGNILMNRIDQIVYTATQFDDIDGIIISINGKKQSAIGGEGLLIQGILNRK